MKLSFIIFIFTFLHVFSEDHVYFDGRDNVSKIELERGDILEYYYDLKDRVVKEIIKDEFGIYEIGRIYDACGNVVEIKLPDRSSIRYFYHDSKLVKTERWSLEGNLLYDYEVTSRDQLGRIVEERLPNFTKRSQKWDSLGRKVEIQTDFLQDQILKIGYETYSEVLQRNLSICDHEIIEYKYDHHFQLISEKRESSFYYEYDLNQNRASKNTVQNVVDENNRLIVSDKTFYSYDQNGNLVRKTIEGQNWYYHWDLQNRLIKVIHPDCEVSSYTYDLSGKRLSKKIEREGQTPKIFRYFYLDETEIGALDENGTIVELKVLSDPNLPEVAPAIAFELYLSSDCRNVYIPIYDLQGNVSVLVQDEKIVSVHRYSAFGEMVNLNETPSDWIDCPWRYRGKRFDQETGLVFFGARYLDTNLGRWISPDPAGDVDGPNGYLYALNNPITYVDYFGLSSEVHENQCNEGMNAEKSPKKPFLIRSVPFCIGKEDLSNGAIGFINGINTSKDEAIAHADRICSWAMGAKIYGVYNATHRIAVDVIECLLGYCRIPLPPVQLLKNQWTEFFSNAKDDSKFLQICHSGGAIHVFNALSSSPLSIRKKIIVLAISPGVIIPKKLCYKAYNWMSKKDFIPVIDLVGYSRYGKQLKFVNPSPNTPTPDHNFDSPTYQEPIQSILQKFITKFGIIRVFF